MQETRFLPILGVDKFKILPGSGGIMNFSEKIHIKTIDIARESSGDVVIAEEIPDGDDFSGKYLPFGLVSNMARKIRLGENKIRVFAEGGQRVKILSVVMNEEDGIPYAEFLPAPYKNTDTDRSYAGIKLIKNMLKEFFGKTKEKFSDDQKRFILSAEGSDFLARVAEILPEIDRTALVMSEDFEQNIVYVGKAVGEASRSISLEQEIDDEIQRKMRSVDREAVIRAKIRNLEDELDETEDEDAELFNAITDLDAPKEVVEKLRKEFMRMNRMSPSSGEVAMLRNYIEYALELPWNKKSKDKYDLINTKTILDEDHYGLDEIKDRILEFLAVKVLSKGAGKGSILCLVGPPGVGKTSIAQSIARAIGKKYAHMSLGGIKDESEIRGHRKTYLGAMPGRILTALSKSGVSNPLFLLDEIDKLSNDMRGDPSSALLEVLDPAQNKNFRDNYLEMPYDLSDVMFIATANNAEAIQKPLLDRMEVIEMSGYTQDEKLEIAKRYLVKKQLKNCGIPEEKLIFEDGAIIGIIDLYTRESGVRELERKIGSVCRKVARKIVEKSSGEKNAKAAARLLELIDPFVIGEKDLADYLGKPKFRRDIKTNVDKVGEVTGLAWTSVGGETLKIEVSLMKGKGQLMLTGKLGEVMQESAKAAVSYLRANSAVYGIDNALFETRDIHIHVPEGAVPKDGPSAGVTITTALLSAFTGMPVRGDVAMTGEVTLHGDVLAIGGLKEKALAAMRQGIKTVIIPADNKPDLDYINAEGIRFVTADKVDTVFKTAIVGFKKDKKAKIKALPDAAADIYDY